MSANQFSLARLLAATALVCIGLACALRGNDDTLLGCLLKYPGAGASFFAAIGVLEPGRAVPFAVIGAALGFFCSLLLL